MILGVALEKRDQLKTAYEKLGRDINPLLLIQLPNDISKMRKQFNEKIIKILKGQPFYNLRKWKNWPFIYSGNAYLSGKPTQSRQC